MPLVKSDSGMPPVKSDSVFAPKNLPTQTQENRSNPEFINMLNQMASNKQIEQEMNSRESKRESKFKRRQERQRKMILIFILILLVLYLAYTFYQTNDKQISLGSDVHTLVTAQSFSPIEKLTIIARHCN